MSLVEQHITINATDPIKFTEIILKMGKDYKATIKNGSYVYLRNMPLSCNLIVMVTPETQLVSDANITALPIPRPLTEEQLNELEYDVLLKMGEEAGVKSRKKADIIKALAVKGETSVNGETPKGESKVGE